MSFFQCLVIVSVFFVSHTTQTNQNEKTNSPKIVINKKTLMVNPGTEARVEVKVNRRISHGEIYLTSSISEERVLPLTKINSNFTVSYFTIPVDSQIPGPYFINWNVDNTNIVKSFNFTILLPPVPKNAPFLVPGFNRSTSLKINLNKAYSGHGPIIKTSLLYRSVTRNSKKVYISFTGELTNNESVALVEGLKPYTEYEFCVMLLRPGSKKTDQHGPAAILRTNCGTPQTYPKIIHTYAIVVDGDRSQMYISWKSPSEEKIQGTVKQYNIVYNQAGQSLKQTVSITGATSTVLKNLKSPAVYLVRIRLVNCNNRYSMFSKSVKVTMGVLQKPSSPLATTTAVTSSAISYEWNYPRNSRSYSILHFEYELSTMKSNETKFSITQSANVTSLTKSFDNLLPYTTYRMKVRAWNYKEPGYFSEDVINTTLQTAPTAPLSLRVTKFDINELTIKWREPSRSNGFIVNYQLQIWGKEWSFWKNQTCQHSFLFCNIEKLEEYTDYRFRLRAFTIKPGPWSKILETKTKSSKPRDCPTQVKVSSSNVGGGINITWKAVKNDPSWGNIKSYRVIYHDNSAVNFENWYYNIVNGSKTSIILDQLREETVYMFKVAAVTENIGPYSEQRTIRTPQLPPPRPVTTFNCTKTTSNSATFVWNFNNQDKVTAVNININGQDHSFDTSKKKRTVYGLEPGRKYQAVIRLRNSNPLPSSNNPTVKFQTNPMKVHTEDMDKYQWIALVLGCIAILCLIGFSVFVYKHYCSESHRPGTHLRLDTLSTNYNGSTYNSSLPFKNSTMGSLDSNSCQYVPEDIIVQWRDILFEDIPLGEGNFGEVVKAVIQKNKKIIPSAVKTLKEGCTLEDRRDFATELETMIRIGKHKNVLSLVGACEHDGNMFLCTEYCSHGNLLQYLRRSRLVDSTEAVTLGTYTKLSQSQILQFAYEVAQGMSYLSDKQIIHRDLAARNILLGDDLVCKVADFGLSRGEGIYVKQTASRLPIRWMAIESLNYNVYTSKSDVWSYGVLLWEIVSLGGTPYCGMSCAELYERLPTGYRMQKPQNCNDQLYAIMCKCWKDRPFDRPSFFQLNVALERIIDTKSTHNYVNLAIFEDFNFASIDVNEEQA